MTVEEENEILLATNGDQVDSVDKNKMDDKALSAVAHHVMVHYAGKELIKRRKKKYNPKAGHYGFDDGLKKIESRGETAVTKELHQSKKYKVFQPL